MYAINLTALTYRACSSRDDLQPGETFADVVPVSLLAAIAAAEDQGETNRQTLATQAEAALVNLRAYVALPSPTNAQTVAAVKLLCRVCIALIRLALRKLDAVD